jgi:hypothetical protein
LIMPSTVLSKRQPNGQHLLLCNGKAVGRAFRFAQRASGKRLSGFGVRVDGYYWRNGEATMRGGAPGTRTKTLTEARALAARVLDGGTC